MTIREWPAGLRAGGESQAGLYDIQAWWSRSARLAVCIANPMS